MSIAPPGTAREVVVSVRLNAQIANASAISLTQRGQGTLSTVQSPAAGNVIDAGVWGWVLPNQGSYIARQVGGNDATLRSWREWYPR